MNKKLSERLKALNPDYYTWHPAAECVDVAGEFPFCLGAAIKYIWRAGRKSGESDLQDLRKARRYLKLEMKRIKARKGGKHQKTKPVAVAPFRPPFMVSMRPADPDTLRSLAMLGPPECIPPTMRPGLSPDEPVDDIANDAGTLFIAADEVGDGADGESSPQS